MKGQAAVEYVFTYGIAILALVLAIGFILSSGMLAPAQLIGEECSFGTSFRCDSVVYNMAGTTHVSVNVYNGFPYTVRIMDMGMETREGKALSGTFGAADLPSGANHSYTFTFDGEELPAGNVARLYGDITYVSCAPEVSENGDCSPHSHVVSGVVIGRVLEG